jgi:protein involved in polysaccharide export with SLBB domain
VDAPRTPRDRGPFAQLSKCAGMILAVLWVLSLFGLTSIAIGCRSAATGQTTPITSTASTRASLQPGDAIQVRFSDYPQLNTVQPIDTQGDVTMPLVGTVAAAGRTLRALSNQFAKSYSTFDIGEIQVDGPLTNVFVTSQPGPIRRK